MGKDSSSAVVTVPSARDFEVRPEDAELFQSHLRSFVPPEAFDAHAHFYERSHIGPTYADSYLKDAPDPGGWAAYRRQVSKWMGDRTARGGLFFGMPRRDVDMAGANRFLAAETGREERLKALMLIHPQDDPDRVDAQIASEGFVGMKVYLVYADRVDPYNAEIEEFLPEWAWEIAHRRGLAIMLHLVKPRAMADPANQSYIRRHCLRYPGANLILAHCARSFNAGHGLEGLESLRGLDNVFFDNSAICEPQPVEEILRLFGPSRLLFGTDFPVSELRGRGREHRRRLCLDGYGQPGLVDDRLRSPHGAGAGKPAGPQARLREPAHERRRHRADLLPQRLPALRNRRAEGRPRPGALPGGQEADSRRNQPPEQAPGTVRARTVAGLLQGSPRLHHRGHGWPPPYRHELQRHRFLPAGLCRPRCHRGRAAQGSARVHVHPERARGGGGGPPDAAATPLGPKTPASPGPAENP